MMPKLSIIIPTFNSGSCIENCLRSIGSQVFRDYEIVIQDGGSSDDTLDKVRNFQLAETAIDLKILSEKDRGPYDAMNKAVEQASGDWLYFLGSDDELHDRNVLRAVMESREAVTSDVLYGNVKMVGDSSWAKNAPVYGGIFDLEKLLNHNICHQAIFYRAAFLKLIGEYNLNYAICADWDFNMRCWAQTEFKYVDMIVANSRAGGLSSGGLSDDCFNRDLASNVVRYFGLSIDDPLLNSPGFPGFSGIIKMRESKPGLVPRCEMDSQGCRAANDIVTTRNNIVRAIALHLPQFHPIPENDEWWGKGFTEWTNVAKARPLFRGHYQPHLPADLGFYDLRLPEARAAQAELAAEYGIYGFCYYHYWFNGRRILERPVTEIVRSGKPDFPFCLCWANENWTRRWDGAEKEILLRQRYNFEDDMAHIRALIPLFRDPRYIRVMGKPFFLVYRASIMPDPERTTEIWRQEAEKAGLGGLFLGRVESHAQDGDPRKLGFDVAVKFEPDGKYMSAKREVRSAWWHRHKLGTGEKSFSENIVYRYEDLVQKSLSEPQPPYQRIPCVCPGWDNSARRQTGANIFVGSAPELYEQWLGAVVAQLAERAVDYAPGVVGPESLVLINAWNEWGEGNHLEPCQRWGRSYLEATRRVLGASVECAVEYANSYPNRAEL